MSTREKWLSKAKNSPRGWRKPELDHLYTSWGFTVTERGAHTKYKHAKYKHLRAVVTRSSGEISASYVVDAVGLIDELRAREGLT